MKDKIEKLLRNVSPQAPIWQNYRVHPDQMKVYRDANDNAVGLLAFSTNELHPYAQGISVYTQEAALFPEILRDAKMLATKNHKDRLVTWEYQPLSLFADWLLTQGFQIWRETVTPQVPIADISVTEPQGEGFYSIAQIQKNDDLWQRLLKLSLVDYQHVHEINPMKAITLAEWAKIVLPEVLTDAPLALVRNNQIIAYTFPFADEPGMLTWGWLGGCHLSDLWLLQSAQIQWARRHGYSRLSGEFDSTDAMAAATYRHWPFVPAPVYTMLGRKI